MTITKQQTISLFSSLMFAMSFSVAAIDGKLTQEPITSLLPPIENTMITLKTNHGDIKIELNADKAPLSAANFLNYAEKGYYKGTIFHRVIKNFMIQGGGFEVGMNQKKTDMPLVNEANNGLLNEKYTLAMARTNEPHSATSQFFINTKDNDFLNFSSETSRGWGYAVFAKVVEGMDVVDKIEQVATGQSGGHGDVPIEDVIIEDVIID